MCACVYLPFMYISSPQQLHCLSLSLDLSLSTSFQPFCCPRTCQRERALYVFGGQRARSIITDLHRVSLDTFSAELLDADCSLRSFVPVTFSQRVVYDPEENEMRLLAGVSTDGTSDYMCNNRLYVCKLSSLTWEHINFSHDVEDSVPCRRFGHEFLWDAVNKRHYLCFGNPGVKDNRQLRLSDLWVLEIHRPSRESVLQRCLKLLRLHCFHEMATKDKLRAFKYMKGPLADVLAGDDKERAALAPLLFASSPQATGGCFVFLVLGVG